MKYKQIINTWLLSMVVVGLQAMTTQSRNKAFLNDLACYVGSLGDSSEQLREEEGLVKKFLFDEESRTFLEAALQELCEKDDGCPIVYNKELGRWEQGNMLLPTKYFIESVIKKALAKKLEIPESDINASLLDPQIDEKIASFERFASKACGENNFIIKWVSFKIHEVEKGELLAALGGLSDKELKDFLRSSEVIVWSESHGNHDDIKYHIRSIMDWPFPAIDCFKGNFFLCIMYDARENTPVALMEFKDIEPGCKDPEYECHICIEKSVQGALRQEAIMYLLAQSYRLLCKNRRSDCNAPYEIYFSGKRRDRDVCKFFALCSPEKPNEKPLDTVRARHFLLDLGYTILPITLNMGCLSTPKLLTDEIMESLLLTNVVSFSRSLSGVTGGRGLAPWARRGECASHKNSLGSEQL